MNIAKLANLYALGRISSSKLNKIAQQLKKSGSASPSLEAMLSSDGSFSQDQKSLFEKALTEIGQSIPSQNEAAEAITADIAESIVKGELDEYEGSRKIWKEVIELVDNQTQNRLSVFKDCATAIEDFIADSERTGEDHDTQIQECEKAIMDAARQWLNKQSTAA